MTELELKEKLINLRQELNTIITNGEAETRQLNDDETSRMTEIRSEIEATEKAIESIEVENRQIVNNKPKQEKRKMKEVRLFDIINGIVDRKELTEEQRAFVQNGVINLRTAIQAGEAGAGQENVPELKTNLDVAVRNASVLNKLGAVWFENANGTVSIPRYAGSTVGWKGEINEAADGAGAFTETILSPKRLTAYLDVSKEFLRMDNNNAEAILIQDLANAVAEKLDKTVFGAGTGDTNTPAGIFSVSGVVTGTALSACTYEDVLAVEQAAEEKNAFNIKWVASPAVKYALKGTDRASGFGKMVWENNEIDGLEAIVSNSVVSKGLLAIDPRDLAVADFGGIEITIDDKSRAVYGEIRLVVNAYYDAKLRGPRYAAEIFS